MEGPSATIALVLAEAAAGATAVLWLGRLWGPVRRGFFILTGASALVFALLGALAASSAFAGTGQPPTLSRFALIAFSVFSGVLGLSLAALILRLDAAGRVLGWLAIPPAVALLMLLAEIADDGSLGYAAALTQLLAGALFLGSVLGGLLLGHWYLTDRRLSREHIRRFALLLLVSVAVEAVAVAVFASGTDAEAAGFSVILGLSGLRTWIVLGMVGCTALIAFLIRASLRGESARAVQGATGFFYLAVITAFTAEIAAKVGFLG